MSWKEVKEHSFILSRVLLSQWVHTRSGQVIWVCCTRACRNSILVRRRLLEWMNINFVHSSPSAHAHVQSMLPFYWPIPTQLCMVILPQCLCTILFCLIRVCTVCYLSSQCSDMFSMRTVLGNLSIEYNIHNKSCKPRQQGVCMVIELSLHERIIYIPSICMLLKALC